ncbi:MAG: hypothetical protein ABSB96_02845 [Gaiellaceae bacterium]
MRKRGRPARRQEADGWTARAEPTKSASGPEPESALEDDGLVFWPLSLGEPEGPRLVQIGPRPARPSETARPPRRRLGMTVLFAALFFAGAALTAAAGNEVATIVASSAPATDPSATTTDTATTAIDTTEPSQTDSTATETTETTTTETTGASEPSPTETATTSTETGTGPAEPPAAPTGDQPADGGTSASAPDPGTTTSAQTPASEPGADPGPSNSPDVAEPSPKPQPEETPQPVLAPQPSAQPLAPAGKAKGSKPAYTSLHAAPRPQQIEHEASPGLGTGTVRWINQPLPDPTPPSLRLSKSFAGDLQSVSAANGLDWSFLLAVLRAERLSESGEVSLRALQREASILGQLHLRLDDRQTLLAYKNDSLFAERVLALKHYYSALGLAALVKGLSADRDQLAARLLADPRIDIYPGGREDISTGRLDVRVLAMIAFLADSFGDVRVSCLITGHRLYARPGVISAHIYGRAVDIAALDGTSILGHQQSGSVTEQATRQILLLPAEMVPRQVISLIGLGGPSFPLADHNDHIHIGY